MNTWRPEKTPNLSELAKLDAASKSFYSCLGRGDDPYLVIDEMSKYYVPLLHKQQQLIEKLIMYAPVGLDINKLVP